MGARNAHAVATVVVNNLDGPGEGFNDPAAFVPIGGNPAVTRGQARLVAFQHAAFLWGSRITSSVKIQIDARMDPLACSPTLSTLGQASAATVHRNFPGAAVANTWYPQALANALAGADLNLAVSDATATFNSTVDGGTCSGISEWYYGLDGVPPPNAVDFVSTIFHEIAHSLGFQTFVDLTTGTKFMGANDAFMRFLEQHGAVPADYPSMTDAQRVAASKSGAGLQWNGPNTTAAGLAVLTAGLADGHVRMFAPATQLIGSSVSHFATQATPNQLLEPFDNGPNHNPGLALQVLQDIGWSLAALNGVDVVFIMDATGSTRDLISGWITQIPAISATWKAAYPNARFAVVSHADFPFSPYGNASTNDYGYKVHCVFDLNAANLPGCLGLIPLDKIGGDTPESQWEAIYQVLTGAGRDLTPPVNYNDLGEYPPVSLGQINPMVIYHFTFPESFHSMAAVPEPNYPIPGVMPPVAGETQTLSEIAFRSSLDQFFGLTFVTGFGVAAAPSVESNLQPFVAPGWQGPNLLWANAQVIAPAAVLSPLHKLAAVSHGNVFDVGTDLGGLQAAITASVQQHVVRFGGGSSPVIDQDGDGVVGAADNCPNTFNPDQANSDSDGLGNACDNCPLTSNPNQKDTNGNGIGDACESVTAVPALSPWGSFAAAALLLAFGLVIARKGAAKRAAR